MYVLCESFVLLQKIFVTYVTTVVCWVFSVYFVAHCNLFPFCVDAHSWTQPSEGILSSSPAMPSTLTERVAGLSNSLCKVYLPYIAYVSQTFNLLKH